MKSLQDKSVLVLGLGLSGLAMARWCTRHGAHVTVWDSRAEPPQAPVLSADCPGAELRTGAALRPEALEGVHWLLKSPGLFPHDPAVAPLLQAAQARGLRCGGELDLFTAALAELRADTGYAPQVLAVTGTNGKTTTTALAALLVARAGRRALAAGNIGPTMLDTLTQQLDAGTLPQVWVLELSSFQLADAQGFEPDAAAVLNLTQDHLDWHGSMAAYGAAKARVWGPADGRTVAVVNRDDPAVAALVTPAPAAPAGKAARGAPRALPPREVLRFGLGAPQAPGDFGLVVEGGMAWLVRALPDEEPAARGAAPAPRPRRPRSTCSA